LLAARGDEVIGIIRNPVQAADLAQQGATALVLDLEKADVDALARELAGADAVVFAAGAGPGSGAARKDTVDRAAAELLVAAAETAGVRRYLLISSMGASDAPPAVTDEVFAAYLRAKAASEKALSESDLDWTILPAREAYRRTRYRHGAPRADRSTWECLARRRRCGPRRPAE
jgi:uncharacterized protein YbjT (DUF2867 family)